MTGKRYEAKAWHAYFRHIAANPVIFYENNTAIFNEDNQYDNEQNNSIIIHGNLHIGQFQYYFDDVTDERIFHIQNKKKVLAPFTRDLKRLATNLALIAYCKGFNSIEMIEILEAFTRQYIKSVLSSNRNLKRQHSVASDQLYRNRNPFRFQRECSMIGLVETEHEMQKIDWQSVDSVKNLLILTEQLAMTTANLHCQPIITISPMVNDAMPKNIYSYKQLIQTALSSTDQQQQLIDKICYFSMIYAEIAERDHRLFFKNFRNERIFKSINTLKNGQIQYPLNNTCSVSILIVGGGIGGMATALSFARAGVRVRLIEKNKEFTEVGAGMQLAPNCSRVLDRLGILKKVQTNAVYPKQIVWMDALSGERLTAIDLGEKFIESFGYPYIVVHRADLLNVLYQACLESSMITMETNRMVINVDERPKSLMIECADGIRYDCKMVIAADGLWSSLRKFVCDDGQPISVGYVTYRGTVGIDEVSKEAGLENVQFWIGPDMHLVQYPIRGGKLFNQAAVFKSNKLPDETDQWGTKEELNERFSNGCNHVKNSLKLIQKNFRWPVYE
jgi:salicylate hydroxylase